MFTHLLKNSAKTARGARIAVEELEPRNLLSIFTPAQIRHAYGFDQVTFGTVSGTGAGQTIAIVDAYDDPRIASDLSTFDAQLGLPAASFTKATPQGLPRTDAGWSLEISLDVEWAHATAPGAKILLVEAKSSSFSDLISAVDYARKQTGVAAVSMSWGADEAFLSKAFEAYYDAFFTTPSGHTGVTFIASSGDDSGTYGPQWPAVSPNVISVGGTSLYLTSQGNYSTERAWSGGTGGVSFFESEPSYQKGVQSTGHRTNPDVAMVGDPNTGVYVYTTVSQGGYTGWFQVGGTSVGAPIWAALVAIADQGRALQGTTGATKAALDGFHDTLPALYRLASDFHDVTAGSDGIASATTGYDLVTGLGTPKANLLINDLLKVTSMFPTSSSGSTGSSSGSTRSGRGAPIGPHTIGPNSPTTINLDAALATALLSGSLSPAPSAVSATAAPVINTPAATGIVSFTSTAVAPTALVPPALAVGDAAPTSDSTGDVRSDDAPAVVPAMPINPDAPPTGTETPSVPEQPPMNLVYDDTESDGRWTAAFTDSVAPVVTEEPAENAVPDGSLAVAVALGGFWMTLAERRAWRNRPELAK